MGIGVSTVDLLMLVDEFPSGEIVQRARRSLLQGGGPVATAMVALSRLGSRTAMLDRIGDDWRGRLIIEEFGNEGVCTGHVRIASHSTSSLASILVRKRDGARAITYSPGDCGDLLPEDLPPEVISKARILHLNGRHWDACLKGATIARERGVAVSFDGGAHRHARGIVDLLKLTDICIVARPFAASYCGSDEIGACIDSLRRAGPRIVVVTDGREGSFVSGEDGERFHQPAFSVDGVVDTTGAGDAYHGGFLHGLATGLNLRRSAELASAVAGLSTTALGGRSGLPSSTLAADFMSGNRYRKGPG